MLHIDDVKLKPAVESLIPAIRAELRMATEGDEPVLLPSFPCSLYTDYPGG